MTDWKSEVGFSERLTTVASISSAYRRTSPSSDFSTAHGEATRIEAENFNKASSKEDYQQKCQQAIDKFDSNEDIEDDSGSSPALAVSDSEFDSQPGTQIGRYQKAVHHADGLFSTMYKSKSTSGLLVALKVTTPHMMGLPHDSEREARVLHKAAGPRIIELLETFYEPGRRFILVFPYMPYNLEELLHEQFLTARQIRSHLRDLFSALAHIHSLGIIHRDIKPSNVLLRSPSGPAYLADFGIVWAPDDKASEDANEKITDVGTTCYRPPEILFGCKNYDTTLDLWAAGCVVAEAIDPQRQSLFDAGPLGSELALIHSIFTTLGTPDLEMWPSAKDLPDWGKIEFQQYATKPWDEILSGAFSVGRDLTSQLVRYESRDRISAVEALKHPFFSS